MKTKIKRHSRSVISVLLAVCMLVSCMAVGLVTTDAAKVENSGSAAVGAATNDNEAVGAAVNDSETVGAAANNSEAVGAAANDSEAVGALANDSQAVGAKVDNGASVGGDGTATNYGIAGSFNGWAAQYFDSSSTCTVNINAAGDYKFKVYHNSNKWYGASVTFSGSQTNYYFNTNNSSNATLKVTTTGTYTFKFRRGDNDDGAVSIDIIYPSAAVYYNVNVNGASNGTVTASTTRATQGTNVTLTATPDRGYALSSLVVKNNSTDATVASSTSGNSLSFNMPAANVTVTATFTASTKRTITANATTNGTVTITVKKDGTTVGTATTSATAAATLIAYDGEKLTIKTNPNAGYVVDTCSPPAGEDYPISGDVTVTATFKVNDTLPANQKRAKLSSDTLNNTDLYTKIGATFYDYYTNHEYDGSWYSDINAGTDAWVNTSGNQWNRNPYGYFNQALSVYAKTNGIDQPLYFCAMNYNSNGGADAYHDPGYYYSNKRVNGHIINDSNYLGGNTKVVYGLTGTSLDNGVPTYSDGSKMVLFDKEWLTSRSTSGGSTTEGTNRVYFDPGPWDTGSNVKYYAETQDGNNPAWEYKELSQDANGAYYYDIPTGGNKVIFHRYEGTTWKAKVEVSGSAANLKDKMVRVTSYNNGTTYTDNPIDYHGNDTKYEKGGALATIVEGNFPVVKTTRTGSVTEDGTNQYTYYKFDSTNGNDNVYFTRNGANQFKYDSNGMLEMNYGAGSNYVVKPGYQGGNNKNGGFFPFDVKGENSGYGKDLALGMKLEIPFTLGPNGKIKGDDQKFEFSGDDDLWVFIDGKLVLDLGGNHARTTGNINFATKTASATAGYNTTFTSSRNGSFNIDYTDAQGNPIKHTMTIFYMERGMHESNLQFGFSFAPIPDVYDVEKEVDTTGLNSGLTNQISDTFTFTNTSEDNKGKKAAYKSYQSSDNAQLPGGTTDSNGSLTMSKEATSDFTKQYAQFKGIFTHNKWLQTSETTTGKWLYDTTYEVHDVQNNSTLVKSGRGIDTGHFNFFTTKANADPDFDATHLRTTFTNKLKLNSFTLTKEIEDTDGNTFYDSNANFTFYLSMTDAQGNPLNPVGLEYTRNGGTPETLTASGTSNVATGKIKQGDSLFFAGIPAGAKITVWEGTRGSEYICEGNGQEQYYYLNKITHNNDGNSTSYTDKDTDGTAAKFTFTLNQNDNITILNRPVPRVNVSVKKVTNVADDGTYFPISITVSTFGSISGTTIDNYMFTTVIPRSDTAAAPEDKPTVYFDKANGIFWMKKDAQIVIANVPKGATVTALETNFDDIDVGKFISRETGTEFYFDAANCQIENAISYTEPDVSVYRFGYMNAEVGAENVAITIANKDIGVKATIRVKYAPSYYDFEHGTNITTGNYKPNGSAFEHITQTIGCVTDFTDEASNTAVISRYETVETARKDGSKNFEVRASEFNAGGYLFIGWYDENGHRYNASDDTQHNPTARAPKDQDRVFEARFIPQPTYRVDYDTPTRLWGKRIYKVFGKVNNSMINNGYIGYDSDRKTESTSTIEKRYFLTASFVEANKPFESIFLKNITWPDFDEGKTSTEYNKEIWVTSNTDKNVENVTQSGNVTYNMYRYVAANVSDIKVAIKFYNDCSDLNKLNLQWEGNYGGVVYDHSTLAENIPAGKTFYRWRIETLNSLGGKLTADNTPVTYDYSTNFNYVAYDNYKVTAECIDKIGDKDYNPYAAKNADDPYHAYAPKNDTTVFNLGLTRSHWNDTEDGKVYEPAEGQSRNYTNANYNYDRLFIDLALSYSDGKETKLNTVDNLNVGFIIKTWTNNEWVNWKTVSFSSKELGDKNRIEYYYGFLNVAGNRVERKFRVQPTIGGVESGNYLDFDFSESQFSSQTNY